MRKTDFQEIMASPVRAYQEGLAFFRGRGVMNQTLRRHGRSKFLELHQGIVQAREREASP